MNFLYLFFKIKVKLVEFSFFFIIKKFISFNKIKKEFRSPANYNARNKNKIICHSNILYWIVGRVMSCCICNTFGLSYLP
jgi:hypothetical protein